MTLDTITEDRTDTARALVMHRPDGELYIVEYCSLWQNDDCVGSRIIGVSGPIVRRDFVDDDEPLVPSAALYVRVRDWEGDFSEAGAAQMQADEDAGLVDYPIGTGKSAR